MEHHRPPLYPLVVATPDDLPVDHQDLTDGHTAFCQPKVRLVDGRLEEGVSHADSLSAFLCDEGARIHPAHGQDPFHRLI